MGMDLGFYSWDFIVDTRDGDDKICFLDIRSVVENQKIHDGTLWENILDLQFVGETSTTDPPPASKDEYDWELRKNKQIDEATANNLAFPLMEEGYKLHH